MSPRRCQHFRGFLCGQEWWSPSAKLDGAMVHSIFIVALVAILTVYTLVVFVALPRYYDRLGGNQRARAIAGLERLLAMPSLGNDQIKVMVKLCLANKYFVDKQYGRSIELYRKLLDAGLAPALDAHVRFKLADSEEAVGNHEAAAAHRQGAIEAINQAPNDPTSLSALASKLDDDKRHDEASSVYKRIADNPAFLKPIRAEAMVRLALNGTRSGRPDVTIEYALKAIENGVKGNHLVACHSQLAFAYKTRNDEQNARRHGQTALDIARALKAPVGDIMGNLASIEFNSGKFDLALQICDQALREQPDARVAMTYRIFIFQVLGRHQEALSLARSLAEPDTYKPSLRRTQEATAYATIANQCITMGDGAQALPAIAIAGPFFEGQDNMRLCCLSMFAAAEALVGSVAHARQLREQTESQIAALPLSEGTLKDVYYFLTIAALNCADYEDAIRYSDRYFENRPAVVWAAKAWVNRAKAYTGLGDPLNAKMCYQKAAEMPFDSEDTLRAREELGLTSPGGMSSFTYSSGS